MTESNNKVNIIINNNLLEDYTEIFIIIIINNMIMINITMNYGDDCYNISV